MIVFRLGKLQYASDLSGKGAERAGGRWNSKGVPIIYTGSSRALCTIEIAVHTPLGNIPVNYNIAAFEIPQGLRVFELKPDSLPRDWQAFPHPHSTQQLGDKFVSENKYLVMKVPSVVVQGDYNYLINPRHKDIGKVRVLASEPFNFDERLFNKQ